MNVDLLSIINNTEQNIGFEGEISFDYADCDVSCKVVGKAAAFAGTIELAIHTDADVKTRCSRCLKPVGYSVSLDIAETVGDEGAELEGTVLDIDNIVKNNIVAELPIRFLCKEDCKGICSKCGADLNVTECNCSDEQIDERFAVLQKLLDNKHD